MGAVFVYEIDPIDFPLGTVDMLGLTQTQWQEAAKISQIFTLLHPEEAYRGEVRYGFFFSIGSPSTELWAFRKLDNNGTTVVVSPMPIGFGALSDAYGLEMLPHKTHGVFAI